MNLDGANETDIREEVAAPLLAALGYRRGTEHDIAREMPLSYAREFLGRKKSTDPPLRGRADYILTVTGAGRWVLEIKAPHQPIDVDAIEQAMSYARHPEVSASYAVILNGRRLTVHHMSQRSADPPLADLLVTEPLELASQLTGLLSPAAIRRDCSPPVVDLSLPLADGLRSYARIRAGQIRHREFQWSANLPLSLPQRAPLDEMGRRVKGLVIPVTGGEVRRDETSRIRAKLVWAMPHDELLRFALDKKLMDVEYLALAKQISADIENPTVFDVVGEVKVGAGEALFDVLRWKTQTAGVQMDMLYQGQATGFIEQSMFKGVFDARYECSFPLLPQFRMAMRMAGDFSVEIDPR
jgi:hypothetical protein